MEDIPGAINFQGRLTDTAGNAVTDGSYGVTFTLHYQETGNSPTGWSEVQNVSTSRGYFNTALGSSTPLSGLDFNYPYFLEIHVAGDAQPMYPRQPFSSVPYAMRAKNAISVDDGAVTSAKILNGTITSADVAGATITGSNIASGTITATNIANLTITGGKIAGATITNTNIAEGAIDTQAKAPWAPKVMYGGVQVSNCIIAGGFAQTDASGWAIVNVETYGFSNQPAIVLATAQDSDANATIMTFAGYSTWGTGSKLLYFRSWYQNGSSQHQCVGPRDFRWLAIGN